MNKLVIILLIFNSLFAHSQTTGFANLLSDISNSKITTQNIKDRRYFSKGSTMDFDTYLFTSRDFKSETLSHVAFLKNGEMRGLLMACPTCLYYNTITFSSPNTVYPHKAVCTKSNGIIDKAEFNITDKRILEVGDNNGDKKIDYAAYDIGKSLYAVFTFSDSLEKPNLFLIYNAASREYTSMVSLKINGSERIFDKGFIKSGDNMDMYDLATEKPVYLKTMSVNDILKGKLPELNELNNSGNSFKQADTIKEKESVFFELAREIYTHTLNNWLEDYKLVLKAGVIGARFPRLVVIK